MIGVRQAIAEQRVEIALQALAERFKVAIPTAHEEPEAVTAAQPNREMRRAMLAMELLADQLEAIERAARRSGRRSPRSPPGE